MGAQLTVRQCLPMLFSHAVAIFNSKEAAEKAIAALGGIIYGSPVEPRAAVYVREDIRSDLRSKGIQFLSPNKEEIYGKWGLPKGQEDFYAVV